MMGLVRHRQTKGPEMDRSHLNHRVTPRLYNSAWARVKNQRTSTGKPFGTNQNILAVACSADLPSVQGPGTMAFCPGVCSCDAISGRRTAKSIATTAWRKADVCS